MIKQLDLLPREIREREQAQRQLWTVFFGALAGAACCALLWVPLRIAVINLEQRVVRAEQRQEQEATVLQEAIQASLRSDKRTVERIAQLNLLAKEEVSWEKVFDLVNGLIPQGVRLATYGVTGVKPVQVQMAGSAESNATFAAFVQSLNGQEALANVTIASYTYEPEDGSVTFSLEAEVAFAAIGYREEAPATAGKEAL